MQSKAALLAQSTTGCADHLHRPPEVIEIKMHRPLGAHSLNGKQASKQASKHARTQASKQTSKLSFLGLVWHTC